MEITIAAAGLGSDELIQRLEGLPAWRPQDVRLISRRRAEPFRDVDTTVVVAIVSSAGTALGALIAGVVQLALASKKAVVALQDKEGRRLEFPRDYAEEEIDRLVETLRRMEEPRIEVV